MSTDTLARSSSDKYLGGVCGGIARTYGLDPTLTRLVTAALVLFTGIGPFAYVLAWVLLPEDSGRKSIAESYLKKSSDQAPRQTGTGWPTSQPGAAPQPPTYETYEQPPFRDEHRA